MKLFKPFLFAVSVCTLAGQAGSAQAENISLRLGYSQGRTGLVITPVKAQVGEFAVSQSLPDHATGRHVRILAKNKRGEVLYEVTAKRPGERNIEVFNALTGAIEHVEKVSESSGVMEVSMPFDKDVASIEVLAHEVASRVGERAENMRGAPRMSTGTGTGAGTAASSNASQLPLAKFERGSLERLLSNNRIAPPPSTATTTLIINNGSPSTRMDFVFVGDGYTAAEMGKWATDAQTIINGYMADPLFAANRSSINVRRVDIASNQSGVDEIDLGIYKDTAMDGEFGCFNTPRLLCVSTTKVLNIVGSVLAPDQRDVIIVVSNSARYGGSGGEIATTSMNVSGIEVALHEIGHTAFALADEYTAGTCDLSSEPTSGNVSRNWNRSVKWASLISANTPVPTQVGVYPNGTVGTFQGAQYCTSGKYRPTEDSRMRTLGKPWHAVNEGLAAKVFAKYGAVEKIQTGTLAVGGSAVVPSGTPAYVQAGAGTLTFKLTGPTSADFDLLLYKWNDVTQAWVQVASSTGSTSTETITYNGTAAYYYAKVLSYRGSGSYTVKYTVPPK